MLVLSIVLILVLILLNGALSMAEFALLNVRKGRLQKWAKEGNRKAGLALELTQSPNRFLSTVQIGITLIAILSGAFGEATIAEALIGEFNKVPWLVPYSQVLALAILVIGVTYFSIVLGELVPKRLALRNPDRIATAMAGVVRTLSLIGKPLVVLLSKSTDLSLRLLRVRPSADLLQSEEDIRELLEEGTQSGEIATEEQEMVEGIFSLGDKPVEAVMTPRTEIVWLDLTDSPEEIRSKIEAGGHSRYPVCRENLDRVQGIADIRDLLRQTMHGEPLNLEAVLQEPLYFLETLPASKALAEFKRTGQHFALVADEYGGVAGALTINDLLSEIVGEMWLEEPQAMRRPDGSWLLDGLIPADDLRETLVLPRLPAEEKGEYHTLAGFVIHHLNRIPKQGDCFRYGGWEFEVLDMDGLRVDKVLATAKAEEAD